MRGVAMISLTSPVKTWAHSWPAWSKLLGLCLGSVVLFQIDTVQGQAIAAAVVLLLYAAPGLRFLRNGADRLSMLWPFVVIVGIFHVATGDIAGGATILLRMFAAVGLANLVTMTTPLSEMMEVVRWLMRPFRRFGVRSEVFELATAMVIRFTPVLIDKGAALSEAWRARSPRRPSWRIVMPLMIAALDDADHVAEALKARGGVAPQKER